MNKDRLRRQTLQEYGAEEAEVQELLIYNTSSFKDTDMLYPLHLPLPAEMHVPHWETYLQKTTTTGLFPLLQDCLVQFQFPIQEGISNTENYLNATRRGIICPGKKGGLRLKEPEKLRLLVHQSLAGKIPVLMVENREDFVTLIRALVKKNEPAAVPDSMGACMVAGYNNWDRIRQLRKEWEAKSPFNRGEARWQQEFASILSQKELYQDRFIILSDGPYSAVPARELGISESEWRKISLHIRLEHECTHYFTRRVFHSMRNNLYDELLADFMGIISAVGEYRPNWFLRFMGLESYPQYREGGRLQNYRGTPPLSEKSFEILQALVKAATEKLDQFAAKHTRELSTQQGKALALVVLVHMTLEELACTAALNILEAYWERWKTQVYYHNEENNA